MNANEIPPVHRLTGAARITAEERIRLTDDYARALAGWWPRPFAGWFLDRYALDLSGTYAGRPIDHPFGKGSGQLTMTPLQIRDSAEAGLAFVVLKTVIGEDDSGTRSMGAWVTQDTRMVVEPIFGRSGRKGWTVTWKGRGWGRSFADYLEFCGGAFETMGRTGLVVAPSVKMHLPEDISLPWRDSEYEYVMGRLCDVWRSSGVEGPMPLEKDFSPTLAGDDRARSLASIDRWIDEVVPRMRRWADSPARIGLKLLNFVGPVDAQRELLSRCLRQSQETRPDFLVYANRLFAPDRVFEGQIGVAYGGPDLSDRNLAVLDDCRAEILQAGLEISATGDVDSGRTAAEYALRGCSSVQIHTLFQVPGDMPPKAKVGRLRRTLARLIFHPEEGLAAWLMHARTHWGLAGSDGVTRWSDMTRCASAAAEAHHTRPPQ